MIERVAECIRKFQAIIDVEHDHEKKLAMMEVLAGMKADYDLIVKDGTPCPPEMVEKVDQSLKLIEDMYNKIACN